MSEFVNTIDVASGTDELSSPEQLTAWLRRRGQLGEGEPANDADLALARELRAALRAELRTHHGGGPAPAARRTLDRLAAELPLRAAFGGHDAPRLEPLAAPVPRQAQDPAAASAQPGGARAGLSAVLVSVVALAATGAWARLKVCPEESCQWAFYDESRNRSRRWCSMGVCGNRSKVRAYRDRHKDQHEGSV